MLQYLHLSFRSGYYLTFSDFQFEPVVTEEVNFAFEVYVSYTLTLMLINKFKLLMLNKCLLVDEMLQL